MPDAVVVDAGRDEVPVPVGLRLFLPESWTSDQDRMAKAGVPEEMRLSRTKPEIALGEIDRLVAADVQLGTVLADAGYGPSAAFRQGQCTQSRLSRRYSQASEGLSS